MWREKKVLLWRKKEKKGRSEPSPRYDLIERAVKRQACVDPPLCSEIDKHLSKLGRWIPLSTVVPTQQQQSPKIKRRGVALMWITCFSSLFYYNSTMDPAHDKNKDNTSTTETKIHDLYNLIHSQRCCMMTTRCAESGRLVSRAMAPCPVNHFFLCYALLHFLDWLYRWA